jgi:hypothetical protein
MPGSSHSSPAAKSDSVFDSAFRRAAAGREGKPARLSDLRSFATQAKGDASQDINVEDIPF